MSHEINIIKLKELFNKEKKSKKDTEGKNIDLNLKYEVVNALYFISESNIKELISELYYYLEHPDEKYRFTALINLGYTTRLHVDGFGEKAYNIYKTDLDDDVNETAFSIWTMYLKENCHFKEFLRLYEAIITDINPNYVRVTAYATLLKIYNKLSSLEYLEIINYCNLYEGSFEDSVDWKRVQDAMDVYVPGWKDIKS